LIEAESGHFVSSSTHKVIRDRDFLITTTVETDTTNLILIEGIPCTVTTRDMNLHFSFQKKPGTIPATTHIAYLDADKLTLPLVLRRWRQGDYFYPLGMGMKKKKLSKFFIDQKIPVHEKEKIWVLESDKRIVWVAGWRLDERFKIKPTTEKALKIETWVH
jgi:tRNA(Ile)-lysidine synthase